MAVVWRVRMFDARVVLTVVSVFPRRGKIVLGYTEAELRVRGSGYQFIHAADMLYCAENHVRSKSPAVLPPESHPCYAATIATNVTIKVKFSDFEIGNVGICKYIIIL